MGENAMTIQGGIKTIKVLAGKENEFENLFNTLKKEVQAKEAGNQYYDLYRSKTNKNKYYVMERYKDEQALDAHKNSAHGMIFFPQIRALLESIEVEYFDAC
jgi:quinol monooxygenase YgiN